MKSRTPEPALRGFLFLAAVLLFTGMAIVTVLIASFGYFPTGGIDFERAFFDYGLWTWYATAGGLGLAALGLAVWLAIFDESVPTQPGALRPLRDRLWTDVSLAALVLASWLWYSAWQDVVSGIVTSNSYGMRVERLFQLVVFGLFTLFCAASWGSLFLTLVRRLKSGRLIRDSLCFLLASSLWRLFRLLLDGRHAPGMTPTRLIFRRQVRFVALSFLLTCAAFLGATAGEILPFLLAVAFEAAAVYWFLAGTRVVTARIDADLQLRLDEQMKAERTKIALVTNVSHDLKTPLTSIVSYVELLGKEDGLSPVAQDYVRILADKSNRLGKIVMDLFELAKSTGGELTAERERIDLKRLVEQTLGDMEDAVAASGIPVKVRVPNAEMPVEVDGKRIYRVFQNVLGNALKYAMPGTRIFVALECAGGEAVATVRNTAGYEMDFTAEEILQRFARGDKSRGSEGSGLGLSIAESFTRGSGGDFQVEIDGDQFKTVVRFPLCG